MSKFIDLTGQRFGYWKVLRRVPPDAVELKNRNQKKPNGEAVWYCQCKCGDVSMIIGSHLRRGLTHGCASCSAYGRHNGGNTWKAEDAERKRREDARKANY